MKYKCTKDIHFYDVLVAAKGDEVEVIGTSLVNVSKRTRLDDWETVNNMIKSGILTQIDKKKNDNVNHPRHYCSHPSGTECIEITRHYCFSIGNAIKYLWRAGLKVDASLTNRQKEIEDLEKAIWYIKDRIKQLRNEI